MCRVKHMRRRTQKASPTSFHINSSRRRRYYYKRNRILSQCMQAYSAGYKKIIDTFIIPTNNPVASKMKLHTLFEK